MEYTTIQKTADRWGVSKAYVHILCQEGRIPGVVYENRRWRVPVDAKKPEGTGPMGTVSASKKAKEWGVPVSTVTRLCGLGLIPGTVQVGRLWHIPEDAVYPLEGFVSVAEMAEKWGMSRVPVSKYCKEGRIPGVKRVGRDWYVPVDAEKPGNGKAERKPGFVSASEMARRWGTSRAFVCRVAKEGRIPGAAQIDGYWHIPEDAKYPLKEKKSSLKEKKSVDKRTEQKTHYLTALQMAEKWGTSPMFVKKAARNGRIPGAKNSGNGWRIPEDAVYPGSERRGKDGI